MENQIFQNQECPECGRSGKFIPPPKKDTKRKKYIITFQCPEGHKFIKEFDAMTPH